MSEPTIIFPAEWSPQDAVAIAFPHDQSDWSEILEQVIPVFTEIIVTISRYEKVLVICQEISKVKELFPAESRENILFFEIPANDTWARDFMPLTVLHDCNPVFFKYMFNGWGLKFPADLDNLIASKLYETGVFNQIPLIQGGIVAEGGAFESDGLGTLMSTTQCMLSPNRNPHLNLLQTEEILRKQLGITNFLWLHHGYLAGDDTDSHIDTLARFCSPDTIAYVSCEDKNDEHYTELKLMEDELRNFRQVDGRPYQLIALPMAPACYDNTGMRLPATYANFLIINGAVLLPVYGNPEKDNLAVEILAGCFWDREIIPVDCRMLTWQHGSLHCVTMQFPAGTLTPSHQVA